jgi:hypothetical protein
MANEKHGGNNENFGVKKASNSAKKTPGEAAIEKEKA